MHTSVTGYKWEVELKSLLTLIHTLKLVWPGHTLLKCLYQTKIASDIVYIC